MHQGLNGKKVDSNQEQTSNVSRDKTLRKKQREMLDINFFDKHINTLDIRRQNC